MKSALKAALAIALAIIGVAGEWPALSNGITAAGQQATANPDRSLTRAEFAAMLNEAFQYELSDKPSPFSDVPRSHWAHDHLATAWHIGYMVGNAGKAEPDRPVTRQEAAVMISGLPEFANARLRMTVDLADGNSVAGWARLAVYRMAGSGILTAGEDGRFRPGAPITAGEASTAFQAAKQWLEDNRKPLPMLEVSRNGRYLETEDGEPFFWLGDTAWELAGRLDRQEAKTYLENTAGHGFTVVKFVLITELGHQAVPNAYGHFPLLDKDPARPATTPGNNPNNRRQYDYWDHVDYLLDTAESLGLYVALLPTWGSYLWKNDGQRADPLFDKEKARLYGEWLGRRYGERSNVIWVLGGDRIPDTEDKKDIIRSMVAGLKEGGARQLMTYHPWGGRSSSEYFHGEEWLDFNSFQSGHKARNDANYRLAEKDYARKPAKPTLDLEPRYEEAPINFNAQNGLFDAYDVRQAAYWSVFAGSFGHSYGHHSIWQMYKPGFAPFIHAEAYWQDVLDADGRSSMKWLRALLETFPAEGREPDPALIRSPHAGGERIAALRGRHYALVYSSQGKPFSVNTARLGGAIDRADWYNPRNGALTEAALPAGNEAWPTFTPPGDGRGQDWVLIIQTSPNRRTSTPL